MGSRERDTTEAGATEKPLFPFFLSLLAKCNTKEAQLSYHKNDYAQLQAGGRGGAMCVGSVRESDVAVGDYNVCE